MKYTSDQIALPCHSQFNLKPYESWLRIKCKYHQLSHNININFPKNQSSNNWFILARSMAFLQKCQPSPKLTWAEHTQPYSLLKSAKRSWPLLGRSIICDQIHGKDQSSPSPSYTHLIAVLKLSLQSVCTTIRNVLWPFLTSFMNLCELSLKHILCLALDQLIKKCFNNIISCLYILAAQFEIGSSRQV